PLKGVAVGATVIVAVGILDDVFDLPARWKLLGQVSAVAVAMRFGVVLDTVPTAWPGSFAINVVLTLMWFLAVMKALQFLDGTARVVTGKVHSVGEWLTYTAKDHIHHRFEALGLTRTETVLLILFIAATLGVSAMLLKDATTHQAALVLIQAGCVLAIIAVLEGVARGR